MKFIHKIASTLIISMSILTSTVGSTVNAYVPTITRTFTYDNATVTGALMAASNIAADTSATKNFSTLKVEIKKNGNVIAVGSSNNVHYINTNASHPGGTISSVHTAYKNNTDYGTCTIVA